jgi:hypothetical protein
MSKFISAFQNVDGIKDVYTTNRNTLRCTAFRLSSGGLCLYSPVAGLGAEARDSLRRLGEVIALLAPNHYHNKGLGEYADAFPSAKLLCTAAAKPRLEKVANLEFDGLNVIRDDIPKHIKLLEPNGLKTGEIWIRVRTTKHRVLIVTDAFCGPDRPMDKYAERPSLLGTFPRYGVGDKNAYCAWLEKQISKERPTILIPCHGAMVRNPKLADDLIATSTDMTG